MSGDAMRAIESCLVLEVEMQKPWDVRWLLLNERQNTNNSASRSRGE